MAKVTGPQEIPSELLDGYRASMGEVTPIDGVRKRYPYRVPTMQTEAGHPSTKQRAQRARFLIAKNDFADVDWATRQRWYAARPEWGSFLWYYNYFIMSDLTGNADVKHGGVGVIKSIQFKTIAMPGAAGEGQVAIDAIDPTKSVVMLYGNSVSIFQSDLWGLAIPSYPYVSSLAAELVKCKWAITGWGGESTEAANIGITVIEYV